MKTIKRIWLANVCLEGGVSADDHGGAGQRAAGNAGAKEQEYRSMQSNMQQMLSQLQATPDTEDDGADFAEGRAVREVQSGVGGWVWACFSGVKGLQPR